MECRFKDIREQNNKTQKDCAEIFGVTLRAWQSYEQGKSEPKYDLLCRIADHFRTTTDYLLGRDAPAPLTLIEMIQSDDTMLPLERAFLARYLISDEKQRKWLCDMMRAAAAGEAVPEGIEDDPDLIIIRLPLYDMPVSAGTGAYIDDARAELTDFLANEHTDRADFVVRVSGDSMEPDFPDGDYVLIRKTEDVDIGQVGLFFNDGQGYIKRLQKNSRGKPVLRSINPAYEDIPVGDCYTFGEVLGTVRIAPTDER
jgi:transcriptional regulator with XRE-family HTH domain